MKKPLISVIIPSYDRPVFLRTRSIPSVLRQTYPHWELIVVGDGPANDELRTAVESFGDDRIRYTEIPRPDYSRLTREEFWHVAGAEARNHGLKLATGELICPLDDDDEFLPTHFEDCAAEFARGQVDFLYGCVLVRDLESGREVVDLFPWEDPATREMFTWRNIMFHASVCYSRRYLDLPYPLDGKLPADYALWKCIAERGARFGSLARPQSVYYGDTLSTNYRVSVPSLPPAEEFSTDIAHIFQSRTISNRGPYCERFEKGISARVTRPTVVAPSGDVALMLAFAALAARLKGARQRRVIVPSYTHASTVNALLWSGFEPLFCDIEPDTLCTSPALIEPLLDETVAAILPVHAHGNPCAMRELERLAQSAGCALIADAAAAFGATIDGQPVGSFGDLEILSFSGTKVLTCGEGGAVCCRDEAWASLVRRLGGYGISRDYVCESRGINGKLSEVSAALGLANLARFNDALAHRQRAAEQYQTLLEDLPQVAFQRTVDAETTASAKDFPLILSSADEAALLAKKLRVYRIDSRPYYRPLHVMPAFAGYPRGDLSNTERLRDAVLCVPIYNHIAPALVELISQVIRHHFGCAAPVEAASPALV